MFKQMINVFGNEEDIDINVITYDNADNLKNDLNGGKQLDILILNAEFPGMITEEMLQEYGCDRLDAKYRQKRANMLYNGR